ncbi:uncharacterized protein AB675_56 [Cyphellophora attinorum]|uniref:EthD domain-containing protein n=1 Tax=Cyphellophora attinorum TaxID=1664694 RepID=A0A0N1H323_9EURO|nr:uncharacterized protein AB675_56 [Phialophora attinorum]KPI34675.1 hypothetical protein AB675_56 [Phialophora attinorum]
MPVRITSNSHPQIFLSTPSARQLLLKYSQYHISAPLTTALRTGAHALNVEPEFSGAAEFWVEKLEDFGAIFTDPVYLKDVIPDEESFLKRSESVMFVGEEQVKFVAGR